MPVRSYKDAKRKGGCLSRRFLCGGIAKDNSQTFQVWLLALEYETDFSARLFFKGLQLIYLPVAVLSVCPTI